MCSFKSNTAKVIAVEGNFDDCQSFVKNFFDNHKDLNLSSANSINIARLIPQVVYYFYSYVELVRRGEIKAGEEINFDVPTGNFGNIFAGFYAKKMGLPINNLICASNKNSVLTDFFNTGIYNKNRKFYKTNSPSMDILISSNLERLIFYGTNEDTSKTNMLMNDLKAKGVYDFKNPFDFFKSYSTDEKKTLEVIKDVYDKYNYVIDPHTSVAYNAYLEYANNNDDLKKTVVISTASPFKFPQAVLSAFGDNCDTNAIDELSSKFNLAIPKVLNYPKPNREVLSLDSLDSYIVDVIKCLR